MSHTSNLNEFFDNNKISFNIINSYNLVSTKTLSLSLRLFSRSLELCEFWFFNSFLVDQHLLRLSSYTLGHISCPSQGTAFEDLKIHCQDDNVSTQGGDLHYSLSVLRLFPPGGTGNKQVGVNLSYAQVHSRSNVS